MRYSDIRWDEIREALEENDLTRKMINQQSDCYIDLEEAVVNYTPGEEHECNASYIGWNMMISKHDGCFACKVALSTPDNGWGVSIDVMEEPLAIPHILEAKAHMLAALVQVGKVAKIDISAPIAAIFSKEFDENLSIDASVITIDDIDKDSFIDAIDNMLRDYRGYIDGTTATSKVDLVRKKLREVLA